MPVKESKAPIGKFPLRLMPSVRRGAEAFSQKEGVSLNQFINVAVAEKLVHLQHEEWLQSRPKPTATGIAQALAILDQPTQSSPDRGDELPDRYVSIKKKYKPEGVKIPTASSRAKHSGA